MDANMGKKWTDYHPSSQEHKDGLERYLDNIFEKASSNNKMPCPCKKCVRYYHHTRKDVLDHLVLNGPMRDFDKEFGSIDQETSPIQNVNYETESSGHRNNDISTMLHDAFGIYASGEDMVFDGDTFEEPNLDGSNSQQANSGNHPTLENFTTLLKDAEDNLYPGCTNYSKLSFILNLYHAKCKFGWSDTSFGVLLNIFKKALPEGAGIPETVYEATKIVEKLSLKYEKIDACPNDCMLFWKDKVNATKCCVCNAPRWKDLNEDEPSLEEKTNSKKKRKIPQKVLRYFPLKPRLQRLFMSSKTAEYLRWHDKDRQKDGVLRHPADAEAWKAFDSRYPNFANDPRNVRLGLASDGFNPFAEMRSTYSTWPVILMPYNLPPWLCMKKEYMMLSMLIPGPKAPGNSIDIYLQPLIDELKELWDVGMPTYDAYSKENFQLFVALKWTINDFPAYGNLSGWCTYGRNACPVCNENTCSNWYKHANKFCYMGHRRFLKLEHKYRNDAKSFDNTKEWRVAPSPPSGSTVLDQLKNIHFVLGKTTEDELSGINEKTWKKKSIFFELPYWEFNLLRHNLDVMHIEKNVCDNLVNTLLDVDKKSKDNLNARRVLKEMEIRPHLWPVHTSSGRVYLPPAPYNMNRSSKDRFCEVLANIKFPDGYASNISRCVLRRKLSGLKSHDCHVLMQHILPLAMREGLHEQVTSILIELCDFFRALCKKSLIVEELDLLEEKIAITICNMEKIFPPTFFTIMVHLVVHLAYEAKIGGSVMYRWMYPIERYLSILKGDVHNKARPEGCMAKAYLLHECIMFYSRYLDDVDIGALRSNRNHAETIEVSHGEKSLLFTKCGQPYGRIDGFEMDETTRTQAHRYVLFNCDSKEVESLREEHIAHLKRVNRRSRPSTHEVYRLHNEQFTEWFRNFVNDTDNKDDERITEDVKTLAMGPLPISRRFQAFDVDTGYRFRTMEYERNRKTQNSGVMVVAQTQSYASTSDRRPVTGDVTYYGRLTDIVELNYYGRFKVVLFRCDWVDVTLGRGLKRDKLGFSLVNFSHLIHHGGCLQDEPFVFASQADQVIFVQDRTNDEWFIPIPIKPRDVFDMGANSLELDRILHVDGDSNDIDLDDVVQVNNYVEGRFLNVANDQRDDNNDDDAQNEDMDEDNDHEFDF